MSRLSFYIRNLKFALIGHLFGLILSFISRMVFVKVLSAEYLGLNGLFSNLLTIISLAELGVGNAITYSLYKPLAENDEEKIHSLMQFYKKTYNIIGFIVIIIGLILSPFLSVFIKEMPDIPSINLLFLMFVLNSAISYFYSYKRSLIIADQKSYIDSKYHYIFYLIFTVLQIIALIITHNYFVFILLTICFTFSENYVISKFVDKMYPFLKLKNKRLIDKNEIEVIKKNVKALMFHKVGQIVINGSSNIILSKFIGIIIVGLLSNYMMIITSLNTLINIIFNSVTASVGNLGANDDKDKAEFIFSCLNFVNFWINLSISICILISINTIIGFWLGDQFLLSNTLVFLIVVNFYIIGMRRTVLTFRNAFGLYWQDRYKPIFEIIIFVISSILLIGKIGAMGVFLGTIISTLLTCYWIEPYILYKYAFKTKATKYYIRYCVEVLCFIIIYLLTKYLCGFINYLSLFGLLLQILLSVIIPTCLLFMFFFRTKELKYLIQIIKKQVINTK